MNIQNIISFVTTANLSGINAINNALSQQANNLKGIASAAAQSNSSINRLVQSYKAAGNALKAIRAQTLAPPGSQTRLANGRFGPNVTQAQYNQQLAQAATFAARMRLILGNAGRLVVPNVLAGLKAQLASAPGVVASAMAGVSAAVLRTISFTGITTALLAAANAAARGMASVLSGGARVAADAIRTLIGGALNFAQGAAQRLAGVLRGIRKVAVGVGLGGALLSLGGLKSASTADAALAKINTIARTTKPILDDVANSLERVGATTGTTFSDLAAGFYDVLSAGLGMKDGVLQFTDSMKLMEDASNLAVGGIGSVGDSVDFLTTVLNAFRGPLTEEFGSPLKASGAITDAFAKSVELGKVTIAQLGPVFSNVAPLAAQLGLDFRDTAAFVAVMTQQGFSAGKAITALRSAMVGTQRSAKLLTKALSEKIVKGELAKVHAKGWLEYLDAVGFQKFAQVLRDYSERSGVPLIKLLGRIEGVQAILGSTGSQAQNYQDALKEITESTGNAAEQAKLLNDNLKNQLVLFGNALFAIGDALFRRRIIDPLKEFVKQLIAVSNAIDDFVINNKVLFDIAVPIFELASAMLALTAGASAVETVFLRIGGPVSGFALGIGAIAHAMALVLAPVGLFIVLYNTLRVAVDHGLVPFKNFGFALELIDQTLHRIGDLARNVADGINAIIDAIKTPMPDFALPGITLPLAPTFDPNAMQHAIEKAMADMAGNLKINLDAITTNVHLIIAAFTDAIFSGFSSSVGDKATTVGATLAKGIGDAFGYAWPRVLDTLGQILTFGAEVTTNLVELGARIVSNIIDGVIDTLPKVADAIAGIPDKISEGVGSGGVQSMFEVARKWAASFVDWWKDHIDDIADGVLKILRAVGHIIETKGPEILRNVFDFLGGIVGKVVDVLEEKGPIVVNALVSWVQDAGPKVLTVIGDFVQNVGGALEDIVDAIAPPLAAASGALVDWVASLIPTIGGTIARFIDSVVKALVPMGSDSGELHSTMNDAGSQLVKWITDRVPDAVKALGQWLEEIETWVGTVLIPRLGLVLLAAGALVAKALFEGLVFFVQHPGDSVKAIAEGLLLVLGALAILNAGTIAGTAVGLAFRFAMRAAIELGKGAAILIGWLATQLTESAIIAGTAAGLAGALALAAAFALPVIAVVLVTFKVAQDIAAAKQTYTDTVAEFVKTGSTEGIQNGIKAAQAQLDSQKLFGVIPWEWAGEGTTLQNSIKTMRAELERRIAASPPALVPWMIGQPVLPMDFKVPELKMLVTPVLGQFGDSVNADTLKTQIAKALDISQQIDDFKLGIDGAVDYFNNIPERMKTSQQRVIDALKDPFNVDQTVTDFQTGYALILEAQSSGNVNAIINANALKTDMVKQANDINAAFVAAGQAPPLIVNAITGEITKAGTAASKMHDSITTPLLPLPAFFTTTGNSAHNVTSGILSEVGPTSIAAWQVHDAATGPLSPTDGELADIRAWGESLGTAWKEGILASIAVTAIKTAAAAVAKIFYANSPPGPDSPLHKVDFWGYNTGAAWVDGILVGLQDGPARIAAAMRDTAAVLSTPMGSTFDLAYAGDPQVVSAARGFTPTGRLAVANPDSKPAATDGDQTNDLLLRAVTELSLQSRLMMRQLQRAPTPAGGLPPRTELEALVTTGRMA